MLEIVPKSSSCTVIIVNDNGHDYINFDSSEHAEKEIKTKLRQILKQKNISKNL